jgi:hypothetical protein
MRTRWMLALFPLLTAVAAYGCSSDEDDDATGGAGASGASGSPGSSSSGSGGSGAQGGDASSSSTGEGGAGAGGSGGGDVGGSGGTGGAGEGGAGQGGTGGGSSASACEDCIEAESLECECGDDAPPACGDWIDCTEACLENDFTPACVDACDAMYPGAGDEIVACVCTPACAAPCGPVCQ